MVRTTKAAGVSDIEAKIAKLKDRKAQLEKKNGERMVRLVRDSGLLDFEMPEEALLAALREIAGRFRAGTDEPGRDVDRAAHANGSQAGARAPAGTAEGEGRGRT